MRLLQLRPGWLECYVVLHKRAVGVNRFAVVIALAEFIDRLGFLLVRRNRLPSEPSVNLSAHSARQKLKKSELGYSEGKRERTFLLCSQQSGTCFRLMAAICMVNQFKCFRIFNS